MTTDGKMEDKEFMTSRLDAIKARLRAATPGPWDASHKDTSHFEVTSRQAAPFPFWVAHCSNQPDTDLIAHAPADLAWLIEQLDVAEKALEYYGYQLVPDSLNKNRTQITTETGKVARQALAKLLEKDTGEKI